MSVGTLGSHSEEGEQTKAKETEIPIVFWWLYSSGCWHLKTLMTRWFRLDQPVPVQEYASIMERSPAPKSPEAQSV
jgi:hypothetical protein